MLRPRRERVVTSHTGTFGGEEIAFTATAGTLVLKKDEEDPHASVFYIAYTKDEVPDPSTRPVMFCFNGGPGSSAVWLHLGGFGPQRVAMEPDGSQPSPNGECNKHLPDLGWDAGCDAAQRIDVA